MADLLQGITLVKMAVATAMVVVLCVLAEVVSPRFAGILSGYPLGAAISLFFIGYEIGPEFAAQSAIYTTVALIATQVFAYAYYRASCTRLARGRLSGVLLSGAVGCLAYFAAIAPGQGLALTRTTAAVPSVASILLFSRLFAPVENARITDRIGLNTKMLLIRSVVAAGLVVLITSAAKWVGVRWAGLFAAFPVTLLPLVMIIHATYGWPQAHTILKNVPKGIGSLIVYCLTVSYVYPSLGIGLGTCVSYLLATVYLFLVHLKTD